MIHRFLARRLARFAFICRYLQAKRQLLPFSRNLSILLVTVCSIRDMKAFPFLLLIALVTEGTLQAQKNDIGFLFGFSQRNASIRKDVIQGEARLSMQVNYSRLAREGTHGRIYFEVAVLSAAGLNGKIDETVTGRVGAVVFITPGLRLHLKLTSRFSAYVAGGLGVAISRERIGVPIGQQVVTTKNTYTSFAGNYGGGLDFRLTDHWSLRGEVRDFRAKRETKIPGRNTAVHVGFAYSF